jgi:hypothetical protein
VDVHDIGVRPMTVVQPCEGNAERALGFGEIKQATGCERAFVDAVQRTDDSLRA